MIVDYLLILGFTLRLTRLVTTDDIVGQWVVVPFVDRQEGTRWGKWAHGLLCAWCIGFWIGAAVVVSYLVVPHPIWAFVAGIFTLNYLVGVIATRVD